MKKKLSVKSVIGWIITVVICAFIAIAITNELVPQPQFTVELAEAQNQVVTVYTYHDQGTPFPCTQIGPDTYACDIPQGYWKNAYHLVLAVDTTNYRVMSASINEKSVRANQIVHPADITTASNPYAQTAVIVTRELTVKSVVSLLGIFAFLVLICFAINREVKRSNYESLGKALLCGGTAVKFIGKRALLYALIGVIISCAIAVGCDIDIITGTMNLYGSGVNIYQYQTVMSTKYQIEMPLWPYNLPMTLFYFLGTLPLSLSRAFYTCGAYHVWHYLSYKILNCILLAVTIISILSFLEKRGYIVGEKCRSCFLWSFFNPLVFYVAIVFIQADPFPMCCLALGCLLLTDNKLPTLSGILLGTGLACKMQNLLMLPLVMVLILFLLLKEQSWSARGSVLKALFATAVILAVCMLPNLKANAPLSVMFRYMPLSERVWWTAIQYTPTIFLQFTPGVLICIMIGYLLHVNLKISNSVMAVAVLYMFGAIVLLYSFSMLSTPSTYVHALAAFTVCNVFAKDRLQKFFIAGLSSLIVFEVMFTSIGDILRLTNMFGLTTSFASIQQTIMNSENAIKYGSLLFTISHASMLAFGLHFCMKAIRMLQEQSPQNNNLEKN